MKKVALIINNDESDYNQIYQHVDVRFSFLKRAKNAKNVFIELFPKVLCRDYLSDCVSASILGEENISGIYGFELEESIDTSELLMSVSVVSKIHFLQGLSVIRNLEREFKDLKTPVTFYKTEFNNNYVIVADKAWLKSSITISVFTHIIRCINHVTPRFKKFENLFKYIHTNHSTNDSKYIDEMRSVDIRMLLSNIDEILGSHPAVGFDMKFLNTGSFFTTTSYSSVAESFHNYSGVASFAKGVKYIQSHEGGIFSFVGAEWVTNYCKLRGLVTNNELEYNGLKRGDVVIREQRQIVILKIGDNGLYYAEDSGIVTHSFFECFKYELIED